MPLDVLGCTRVTMKLTISISSLKRLRESSKSFRDGDCDLQLSHMNEECLVFVC
jgi:hypothetical protein